MCLIKENPGQGTMEYLLIVGIVVVVSLVVVGLILNQPNTAASVSTDSSRIASLTSSIGINESFKTPDGNYFIVISTKSTEPVKVKSIIIGEDSITFSENDFLVIGTERGFIIPSADTCNTGDSFQKEIKIIYETQHGLEKTINYPGKINFSCENATLNPNLLPSSGLTQETAGATCKTIHNNYPHFNAGLYWINPNSGDVNDAFRVYCDMNKDGNVWTIVLLNSLYPTPPKPTWNNAINRNNVTGAISVDLNSFDQLVGLKYWNLIGNRMILEIGVTPISIVHKASYYFSLNADANYALSMSNEQILIGSGSSGIYSYSAANNRQFTTYDADHDVYVTNCSNNYSNTSWWYGSCWSGSFWGGGDVGGYQNRPFWTGSGTDYNNWGAIWVG